MHKRQRSPVHPLVLAIAAALALTTAGAAAAQEVRYTYIAPVNGLAAPPAEKPPVSSPDVSVPATVYPGADYAVTWSSVPEANRYDLFQQSAGSAVYSGGGFSLARIAPTVVGATDAFWVRACNAAGCAATSSARGVTVVAPPAPPAPTVTAPDSVVSGSSIAVSWSSVLDPNGYPVTYLVKSQQDSAAAVQLYNGAGLSAALSKAVSPSLYTFTAQACNPYACSTPSAGVGTLAVASVPTTPGLTVPSTVYPLANFSVSWSAATRATRYEVTEKVGSGAVTTVYSGGGLSAAIPSTATIGDSIAIQVRGCNAVGCGSFSSSKTAKVAVPPAPPLPSLSAPSSVNPGDPIALAWAPSVDPNGYAVTYKVFGHKDTDPDTQVYAGSGLSAELNSTATDGAAYYFTAQACNPYGCSDLTPPVVSFLVGADCSAGAMTVSTPGQYGFTVPADCHRMTVAVRGAGGGAAWYVYGPGYPIPGGAGASVGGAIAVTPGDSVQVSLAAGGVKLLSSCSSDGGSFNGTGGGGSYMKLNGTYVIVAGGGGGSACGSLSAGAGPGSLDLSGPSDGNGTNASSTSRSIPGVAGLSYYSGAVSNPVWNASGGGAGGQTKSSFAGQSGGVTITWSKN